MGDSEEEEMAEEQRLGMDILHGSASEVAESFRAMVDCAMKAGPLDARARLLILCGAFVATGQRTAFLRHAGLALEAGATRAELQHAVVITITGAATFPQVVAGLRWLELVPHKPA